MRLVRIGQTLRLRISVALIRVRLFCDISWAGETIIAVTNKSPLIRLLLFTYCKHTHCQTQAKQPHQTVNLCRS